MKSKQRFLVALFMATVMMAMYPTKGWAGCSTHTFTEASNGFCTVCGECQPLGDPVNGWYEISNAGQLYKFASLVNGGNALVNGRLTKDIVVNKGTFDDNGNFTAEGASVKSTPRSWTTIGNNQYYFSGQFDGNGHSVSGLYCDGGSNGSIGFMGWASGATIQNLGIVNSFFKGKQAVGAVSGTLSGRSTIQRCWSDSKVVGTYFYAGGICGSNRNGSLIEDCYCTGIVSGASCLGGICGSNYYDKDYDICASMISNCYSTASVSGESFGSICGSQTSGCTITNCYTTSTGKFVSSAGGTVTNCEAGVLAERFASGEIAYLLNGGENGKTDGSQAWYQKLNTSSASAGSGQANSDSYPVLKKVSGNTVYCAYGATCTDKRTYNNTATIGSPIHTLTGSITWTWAADGKSATATYSCLADASHKPLVEAVVTSAVKKSSTCSAMGITTYTACIVINGKTYTSAKDITDIPTHSYDNGFCTVCNANQPLGNPVDGWYEISNAGQLYSFAALVNGGSNSVKGRLTKDIVVNKGSFDSNGNFTAEGATKTSTPRSWTPIDNFCGQIDGNGYSISGLYSVADDYDYNMGFVEYVYNATIQNLGVVNSYFKGGYYVGAICGCASTVTIKKCWSDCTVKGTYTIGGICGGNDYGSIVEDCYSSGTISGPSAGGITGENFDQKDGIYSSISNCYSTATITDSGSGTICGWNGGGCSVTNCYSSQKGNLIDTQAGNASGCEAGVTASRFSSGEIAYKLNGSRSKGTEESPLVWYQTLGKDAAPKFSGKVVCYNAQKKPAYYNPAAPGDINDDETITIADLTLLIEILNGRATDTKDAADVDGKNGTTVDDVKALINMLLGK